MQHRYGFKKSDFEIDPENGQQYSFVYTRDVWSMPAVGSATHERVGYPTQKPEQLLERIISASSNPGDLVFDCFCGSGTTGLVAEKLNRRWITSDVSSLAIQKLQARLQGLKGVEPYMIQVSERTQ
jgi:DNA modification methylase